MKIVKYIGIFVLFLIAALLGMMLMAPKKVTFVVTQDVNASLPKTWKYATSPDFFPKWIEGLSQVKHVKGEFNAAGDKSAFIFNEGKEDMTMVETITSLEKDKTFGFSGLVEDMMSVESTSTFTPIDSSKSNITIKTVISAESLGMRLFMFNKEGMRKRSQEQYAKLARLIEEEK